TGSRSREVLDRRLERLPTFGRLADLKLDEVKGLLEVLVDAALLERRGIEGGRPGAFVLALSPEGAAVMRAEHRPLLALPGGPGPKPMAGPAAKPHGSRRKPAA